MFKKIINYQVLLGFNVQQGQYQNNLRHTFAATLLWFIWCLASPLQLRLQPPPDRELPPSPVLLQAERLRKAC